MIERTVGQLDEPDVVTGFDFCLQLQQDQIVHLGGMMIIETVNFFYPKPVWTACSLLRSSNHLKEFYFLLSSSLFPHAVGSCDGKFFVQKCCPTEWPGEVRPFQPRLVRILL